MLLVNFFHLASWPVRVRQCHWHASAGFRSEPTCYVLRYPATVPVSRGVTVSRCHTQPEPVTVTVASGIKVALSLLSL